MDGELTEGTLRITTAELLGLSNDPKVTARTIEYWRQEGLLPKAHRTGQHGKRPEWTYPVEAGEQLAALLRLREKTKQPDVLRVALWFEGFSIEPKRVRTSITAVLGRSLEMFAKEIDKRRERAVSSEDSTWAALEQIGRLLARKRGRNTVPRHGRQTREERDRAMTLMLGLAFGHDGAAARLEDDAPHVERMLGLYRARRSRAGMGAWLDGPAGEGLDAFAYLGSLPALIETFETVSDEELAASRVSARIMLDGMAAFAHVADAFAVTENAVGLAAIDLFRDEPITAVWMTAFVIAASRSSALSENLRSIVNALSQDLLPVEQRARELAALSAEDLNQQLPELESLPFIEQVRLKRLIAQYRDEQPG
jgi:hypothetical protein